MPALSKFLLKEASPPLFLLLDRYQMVLLIRTMRNSTTLKPSTLLSKLDLTRSMNPTPISAVYSTKSCFWIQLLRTAPLLTSNCIRNTPTTNAPTPNAPICCVSFETS